MMTFQSFFTISLTVLCAISVVRQYQTLDDYWNRTLHDVMTAYQEAEYQCQSDQRDICNTDSFETTTQGMDPTSTLLLTLEQKNLDVVSHPVIVEDSAIDTLSFDPKQPQQQDENGKFVTLDPSTNIRKPSSSSSEAYPAPLLRTALRRLDERPAFPSRCLQHAWIEQKVHPPCSRALHHFQDLVTLQEHQQRTARLFQAVFGIFWVILLGVWCVMYWIFRTSDFEEIEVMLKKQQQEESCGRCCCCCMEHSPSCQLHVSDDKSSCCRSKLLTNTN